MQDKQNKVVDLRPYLLNAASDRALAGCREAKEYERSGQYEKARACLSAWWQKIGEVPNLNGLDSLASAEVLMRVGSIAGAIGSKQQIEGASGFAKNLILESIRIFEAAHEIDKSAEALKCLGVCYWRDGRHHQAAVILQDAISRFSPREAEEKAVALLNLVIVYSHQRKYDEALSIFTENKSLFSLLENHSILGSFHTEHAIVLRAQWTATNDETYLDRTIEEYEAASFHFQEAGHDGYRARVENNLSFLFNKVGKYREAHEHAAKAARLSELVKDNTHLGQVEDTRAIIYLAEGNPTEAERAARRSVQILERSNEKALLVESLITHGRALVKLARFDEALAAYGRAKAVADEVDEGLWPKLAQAIELPLNEALHHLEANLFRHALMFANGKPTLASNMLGFDKNKPQSFLFKLEDQHPDLLHLRTEKRKRKHK